MFHISLLALLATKALGSPLLTSDSMPETRSPSDQPSYITACEAADNCETYLDPTSGHTNIRFKSGMEPGTDDYNTRVANSYVKRQSGYPQTQVTVGDATIFWGCDIDPVATLNNVSAICATSGQCITNAPWSQGVTYGTPDQDVTSPETLTISASGTYPSWIRNGLVEGVQAAMSAKGIITTSTVNYIVTTGPTNKNGPQIEGKSCTVAKAPAFIGLGVYSAVNVLEATISVTAAVGTPGSGFCANGVAQTAALTGAIAGAFGPIGAGIGAIFGTISAACALEPSS